MSSDGEHTVHYEPPRWASVTGAITLVLVFSLSWRTAAGLTAGERVPIASAAGLSLLALDLLPKAVAVCGLRLVLRVPGQVFRGFAWIASAGLVGTVPAVWVVVQTIRGVVTPELLDWPMLLLPAVGAALAGLPVGLRRRLEPLIEAHTVPSPPTVPDP